MKNTRINDNICVTNEFNTEVKVLFSMPLAVKNKTGMIEIFEKLAHYPQMMLMKSGDNTVDAHSIMGVFSIDSSKPFELLFETEPTDDLKEAIKAYVI